MYGYGTKGTDIVGYTFQTDQFHPQCIIDQLPTGEGGAFDGWALAEGAAPMSVEDNLTEIAAAFQIDRQNEHSFDSDKDFPKVIFASQVESSSELCGACHEPLVDGGDVVSDDDESL